MEPLTITHKKLLRKWHIPGLFNVFINDLKARVNNELIMFADDCKLEGVANAAKDSKVTPKALKRLEINQQETSCT